MLYCLVSLFVVFVFYDIIIGLYICMQFAPIFEVVTLSNIVVLLLNYLIYISSTYLQSIDYIWYYLNFIYRKNTKYGVFIHGKWVVQSWNSSLYHWHMSEIQTSFRMDCLHSKYRSIVWKWPFQKLITVDVTAIQIYGIAI